MKKTYYKWILIQDGEVINHGVENSSIEIFVDCVFPNTSSSVDRNLSEMQDYADKYLSEYNYIFKYKEIKIDFSDLTGE